jgi:seryl-tRNA synthetase
MDAYVSLRDALIVNGLLVPMDAQGLYARSGVFEAVVDKIDALITRHRAAEPAAEVLRFPPGIARANFERSGYMKSFPQLVGTVHCFCGDDRAHRSLLSCMGEGGDWMQGQPGSDIVLTPAACYPAYPIVAARGTLPAQGHLVDLLSWCFRREPSIEPTRLQMFRQREWVRMGSADQVMQAREGWMETAQTIINALELPYEIDVANDPFFGRTGQLLANSQREQQHKFELLIPVNDGLGPTACVSFNYHLDKFGEAFGLQTHDGAQAHTGCVGFGMERLAVAMFRHHGFAPASWPETVRAALQWN